MTQRRRVWLLGALAVVLAAAALFHGSGGGDIDSSVMLLQKPPSTIPAKAAAAEALVPDEFAILRTRNVFARGHGGGAGGPEASFVFKGSVQCGQTFTAFIEDLTAKKIVQAAVGDAIARGRIKSIDLDAVQYATADASKQIEVGENLDGVVVPPAQAAPETKPSAPAVAAGGPQNPQPPTQ